MYHKQILTQGQELGDRDHQLNSSEDQYQIPEPQRIECLNWPLSHHE